MLESCVQLQIFHRECSIMLRLIYEQHTPISNGVILSEPVKGAAFIENNVVTPIKKKAQQGVHDAGERLYDAERYKADLRTKSVAEL